jgi:(1->4)-alpha-D-glucan 1-alpha-D-glucosylmutase
LDFPALVREKKRKLLREQLAAEANRLTDMLLQISAHHWECRDYTGAELHEAWTELAVCFSVYRTYAATSGGREISQEDASVISAAAKAARQHCPDLPAELITFLENLLLLHYRGDLEDDFVLRFQQLTGPVMAKSVEDTAFFCYARFMALNEVGGDPSRFGLSLDTFHRFCQSQQKSWPTSMAATSTHDTKWGGDVRARLALLSEQPNVWMDAVRRWSQLNEPKRRHNWPDRRTEYLFYQALVGAWPVTSERVLEFMQKAVREAKEHTQWQQPAPEYEKALQSFVKSAFDDPKFVDEVERFVSRLATPGWINSLAQTLVKLTATGVPDIYQGAELWDLNLTDPDNRRSVDFTLRQHCLAEVKSLSAADAWRKRESGLAKLWLLQKVLTLRRCHPKLFGASSPYEPVAVSGKENSRVLAFARGQNAVTIVPRLIATFDANWADTHVALPAGQWHNILTNKSVPQGLVSELTADFPVALLVRKEES